MEGTCGSPGAERDGNAQCCDCREPAPSGPASTLAATAFSALAFTGLSLRVLLGPCSSWVGGRDFLGFLSHLPVPWLSFWGPRWTQVGPGPQCPGPSGQEDTQGS